MTALLFVDTNLLIYCLDQSVPAKRDSALVLVAEGIAAGRVVTSPQTLNECYRVVTDRRHLVARPAARAFVASLLGTCRAPLTPPTVLKAWDLQDATAFGWWDCLMLASALLGGCTHFLSEDLQDGQVIAGMTILDPFKNDVRPLLT